MSQTSDQSVSATPESEKSDIYTSRRGKLIQPRDFIYHTPGNSPVSTASVVAVKNINLCSACSLLTLNLFSVVVPSVARHLMGIQTGQSSSGQIVRSGTFAYIVSRGGRLQDPEVPETPCGQETVPKELQERYLQSAQKN
jgi:hypothetical protein